MTNRKDTYIMPARSTYEGSLPSLFKGFLESQRIDASSLPIKGEVITYGRDAHVTPTRSTGGGQVIQVFFKKKTKYRYIIFTIRGGEVTTYKRMLT